MNPGLSAMWMSDARAAALLRALPEHLCVAAMRDRYGTMVLACPDIVVECQGESAFDALDRLGPGMWAGFLSFELGHAVEPVVRHGASCEPARVPDLLFLRFTARARLSADGSCHVEGHGAGVRLLERAAATAPVVCDADPLGPFCSNLSRAGYTARVRQVLQLLAAGECYQVNLTRRLTCVQPADPVTLYAALVAVNPAPHAAFLRTDLAENPMAVISASPERFLSWHGRHVETRPIKGTAANREALQSSAKDHAENVMIVDLARNDLGRVCVAGSVRVPELCALEAHPGLYHLVSTVRGQLRPGVSLGDLLRATFPPASVTGAPKPRVLQAIEDLEPVRRGVYCGALGWVNTVKGCGDLALAIRTFTVTRHGTDLGVGGGIVADSDPDAEWAETELEAARLLAATRATTPRTEPPRFARSP